MERVGVWIKAIRFAVAFLLVTTLAVVFLYQPEEVAPAQPAPSVSVEEAVYEGLIDQEDGPLHDWDADPSGPKVLSLDVIDPVSAEYVETYILTNSSGGFYRIHPKYSRNDPVWGYWGTKPAKITGNTSEIKDFRGVAVKLLEVERIEFSEMGRWYRGILSRKHFDLAPYTFYKSGGRKSNPTDLMISYKILDENDEVTMEVPLASHEGYLYYIPICGTGQPIAMFSFNQTVRVYGLMMPINETTGTRINALMVFDATQSTW